jgi:hypothetical protein
VAPWKFLHGNFYFKYIAHGKFFIIIAMAKCSISLAIANSTLLFAMAKYNSWKLFCFFVGPWKYFHGNFYLKYIVDGKFFFLFAMAKCSFALSTENLHSSP